MKKKMLLIVLVSLFVTVVIVVSVLASLQQRSIVQTFAKQESTLLQFARSNIEIGLELNRIDAVKRTLNQLQDYPIFEGAIIFATEFTPILSIPAEFELPSPLQEAVLETGRVHQEHLTYVAARLNDQDGDLLGHLLIGFTYVKMDEEIRTAFLYAILVGMIILVPVAGIVYWQVTRWTKPLEETTQVLKAVTAGDLTGQLEVTTGDEVGELVKSFNEMAKKIREKTVADMQARIDAAEAANRLKSEFLANVSHELRTPMNAILGFSELLHDQTMGEVQRDYSEAILSSARALLTLINDILDLSKIEAGKLDIQTHPTELQNLFQEIFSIYHLRAADKGLNFNLEIDPDLPGALFLDETRFRQILVNLTGNAIKFTHTGRVTIRATGIPGSEQDHIGLFLEVEDTGIGIPPHQLERIFDAFVQQSGQSNRKYGGTGLGLAITKRLVEMMGGQMAVTSMPDRGSTFTVTLPSVRIASRQKLEAQNEPVKALSKNLRFEGQTVLLVEDNEMNRELIRSYLESRKLKVIEAENGVEALKIAPECLPDAIMMDLQMPEMDGFETTQRLRATPQFETTPIIAVTANAMKEDRERATAVGCDAFLAKPVSLSDLSAVLSRHLSCSEIAPSRPPDTPGTNEGSLPAQAPLSEAEKSRLSTQVQYLTTDGMDRWKELSEVIVPRDIQAFAQEIRTLGIEYNLPDLETWGKNVERYAENFRIEDLDKTLARFPDLVDMVGAHLNNQEVSNHGTA